MQIQSQQPGVGQKLSVTTSASRDVIEHLLISINKQKIPNVNQFIFIVNYKMVGETPSTFEYHCNIAASEAIHTAGIVQFDGCWHNRAPKALHAAPWG